MCGQRRQRRGVEETLFPVGTRAPTVATKLFIAFDGPSSTGPGPARSPANPSRPARCAPGRTALSDRRSVGRPGNGQRVSDPFGDGSSSLDYIYTVLPARPRAATYVPPIDTHLSLSGGVPPNLASFYPADSKSVGNRYDQ